MIRSHLLVLTAFSMAITVSSPAMAQTATNVTFVVTPSSPEIVPGGAAGVTMDSAPGFKYGSMKQPGTQKFEFYKTPESMFGRPVTMGEVVSISYFTKKTLDHVSEPRDYYINTYTKPFAGDVSTPTWYGGRYGTEPYYADNLMETPGDWNQWSSDDSINRLRFFESTAGAPGANFGSYTDPFYPAFVAQNSLGTSVPIASQQILVFSVQTSSAGAFSGQVDGLRVELADGSVASINFEPFLVAPDREACKKDGWKTLFRADGSTFTNQGDCVSYVNTNR